jgi:hypothetical protein
MPVLIAKKPPVWVQEQAKKASSMLSDPIRNAVDWQATKRLMEVNHMLMQLFGWWKLEAGLSWSFQEFKR